MKAQVEKIKEETDLVVFRLDLFAESEDDSIALANLESDQSDVTDQMIQSIVYQHANKLLKARGKDWIIQKVEKKKDHNSYYIQLRTLKLVSIPTNYLDADNDSHKEIEDIILFHLYRP